MKSNTIYNYIAIHSCNMCFAKESTFKVLGRRLNHSQGFFPNKKDGILTTVMKCSNCGLIFSNPQPVPGNIQDHYGILPEAYWKEDYFNVSKNYFAGEIAWLKRLKDLTPGMKSLDIGAGIGKQMISLEREGFDSYGLEPGNAFYDRAISRMHISKEKLKLATIEEAEYEQDFFDFVSFGAVLEHLYDPNQSIQKALSWLKPGGLIHIEVPNAKWLISRLVNLNYKMRGLDYITNLSPMHTPYHLFEFTLKSFEENGEKVGYKLKDHAFYVCDTYMPKVFNSLLKKYMDNTNSGMQLCVWLEKNKK